MRRRGSDVHDVSAIAGYEVLGRFARHQHRAGDVGGESALKAGQVEIHQLLEGTEAGVIDQDVEIAEFFEHFAYGADSVSFLGDVGMDGMRSKSLSGFFQLLLVASG